MSSMRLILLAFKLKIKTLQMWNAFLNMCRSIGLMSGTVEYSTTNLLEETYLSSHN